MPNLNVMIFPSKITSRIMNVVTFYIQEIWLVKTIKTKYVLERT
jgi:hypothetical protein